MSEYKLQGYTAEVGDLLGIPEATTDFDTRRYDMADMVNNPPHYTSGNVECIDAIRSALTDEEFRGYCKGNVIKYTYREQMKGGDEDLAKARWYLEKLLKVKGKE